MRLTVVSRHVLMLDSMSLHAWYSSPNQQIPTRRRDLLHGKRRSPHFERQLVLLESMSHKKVTILRKAGGIQNVAAQSAYVGR